MRELKRTKSELIDLSQELLSVRETINTDRLERIFSEMTLVQYNILKKIWPELSRCELQPVSKITLQDMQNSADIPMTYISKTVENLSEAALVSWERDENGTYIQLTSQGYDRFKKQQDILLGFFDRVIGIMGMDEFNVAIKAMKELETIINASIPE